MPLLAPVLSGCGVRSSARAILFQVSVVRVQSTAHRPRAHVQVVCRLLITVFVVSLSRVPKWSPAESNLGRSPMGLNSGSASVSDPRRESPANDDHCSSLGLRRAAGPES